MEDSDAVTPRQVDFPEVIEVANWAGIRFDLAYVRDACDRLLKTEKSDAVLRRALFEGALGAYARCFKGHDGVRVGFDEHDFESMGEPNVVGLHQFFIALRDKHISHSVNSFEQVTIGVVQLDDKPTLVSHTQYMAGVPDNTLKDLIEMAEFLMGVTAEKSAAAESTIFYRYDAMTEAQISALPTMKATAANPDYVNRPRDGLKRRQRGRGGR